MSWNPFAGSSRDPPPGTVSHNVGSNANPDIVEEVPSEPDLTPFGGAIPTSPKDTGRQLASKCSVTQDSGARQTSQRSREMLGLARIFGYIGAVDKIIWETMFLLIIIFVWF